MRKEREMLYKKLDQIDGYEHADLELGNYNCSNEIYNSYEERCKSIQEAIMKSYGYTGEDWMGFLFEEQEKFNVGFFGKMQLSR